MKKSIIFAITMLISIIAYSQADSTIINQFKPFENIGNDFWLYVLGRASIGTYLGAGVIMAIAITVRWALDIKRGIKNNPSSPDKYSGKYLIKNKLYQMALSIIISTGGGFMMLRLSSEWVLIPVANAVVAAAIGFGFDYAFEKFTSKIKNKINI